MMNWPPVSRGNPVDNFTCDRRLRVLLVCPGLGHVNRGFETFTAECFDALQGDERINIYLCKGAGPSAEREHTRLVPTAKPAGHPDAPRDHNPARRLLRRANHVWPCSSPESAGRPDVIYFSDGAVGNLLWRWRRRKRWAV